MMAIFKLLKKIIILICFYYASYNMGNLITKLKVYYNVSNIQCKIRKKEKKKKSRHHKEDPWTYKFNLYFNKN